MYANVKILHYMKNTKSKLYQVWQSISYTNKSMLLYIIREQSYIKESQADLAILKYYL
jgi:hypothetical protein